MPLAPYHLSVKTIGRAQGRSATAACAYRSGARIVDERSGQVFDYSRRGGVERPLCAIFAPADAPGWVQDRPALWNAVEAAEMRKNSTVAREFEVALPADLSGDERQALVARFAGALVERHGMVVDASIHGPDAEAKHGQGNRNHHAHVLCSTRRIGADGFGVKVRELDNQRSGEVEQWRESFATMCGDALEQAGHPEQAARWRSGHLPKAGQLAAARERGDAAFVAENQDRVPTRHYGPNVIQIERKGIVTDHGERVREPERVNAAVVDFAEAKRRLAAEAAEREPGASAPAVPRTGLLDTARGDRQRTGLLDAGTPAPVVRPPAIVLREWKAETDRQFGAVRAKAERVDGYGRQLLAGHEQRQERHQRARPAKPAGLLAAAKRRGYEAALEAWGRTRAAIQRRIDRLGQQLDRLVGYLRQALPWETGPSAGERLAERQAVLARPALAAEARTALVEVGVVDIDGGIRAAEGRRQAEQRRVERDGRLAAEQDAGGDDTPKASRLDGTAIAQRAAGEAGPDGKPSETEQEKRVAEARERIRAQRDRERDERQHGKDRGRGR